MEISEDNNAVTKNEPAAENKDDMEVSETEKTETVAQTSGCGGTGDESPEIVNVLSNDKNEISEKANKSKRSDTPLDAKSVSESQISRPNSGLMNANLQSTINQLANNIANELNAQEKFLQNGNDDVMAGDILRCNIKNSITTSAVSISMNKSNSHLNNQKSYLTENNSRNQTQNQIYSLKSKQNQAQQLQHQQHLQNRYQQLLKVIDELGKDIRPAYAGSRGAPERLKKGIHSARAIVRECLLETERASRCDL